MRKDILKICDSKYPEIEKRWNEWTLQTCFSSRFNPGHIDWLELVEYSSLHRVDAANFAIDYIESIGSDWCILAFVNEVVIDPIDHEKTTGYIDPKAVKDIYLFGLYEFIRQSESREIDPNHKPEKIQMKNYETK